MRYAATPIPPKHDRSPRTEKAAPAKRSPAFLLASPHLTPPQIDHRATDAFLSDLRSAVPTRPRRTAARRAVPCTRRVVRGQPVQVGLRDGCNAGAREGGGGGSRMRGEWGSTCGMVR